MSEATLTENTMRAAFAKATQDVPVVQRDTRYAMVRSALNRKVGTSRRKTMWSVERGAR